MTTNPDKPEPPAEVWLYPRMVDGVYDAWPYDSPGCHRYDLHVPGSAVIPPEVVEAALESVDCNRHYIALACLAPILRAARGGAS